MSARVVAEEREKRKKKGREKKWIGTQCQENP
jgi:hypothetical protein